MNKYFNEPTEVDGIRFDSKAEARRYEILKNMEALGYIKNLRRQVSYELIPKLKGRKKTYRATTYVADFVYELGGETIVEDVKGYMTEVYKLKKKLMLERHNIEITEVK